MAFNIYLTSSIFSLLIIFFLISIKDRWTAITDKKDKDPRKIHEYTIINTGGLIFLSIATFSYFIQNEIFNEILIASYIMLFIGLIDDIRKNLSIIFRLFILIIVYLWIITAHDLMLNSIGIKIIDENILKYEYLKIFFTVLCLIFLTNGFNFIDGNNGLLLGSSILVLLNLNYIIPIQNYELLILIKINLIVVSILLIFNISSLNIITGNNGAYFLGTILGLLCLYTYKISNQDPFMIACILFYPVFEMIFTFFRRVIFEKKNPFLPDNLHLHSIIFKLLKEKQYTYENLILNNLTSFIILLFLSLINLGIHFIGKIIGYPIFLTLMIICYLSSYYLIFKKITIHDQNSNF